MQGSTTSARGDPTASTDLPDVATATDGSAAPSPSASSNGDRLNAFVQSHNQVVSPPLSPLSGSVASVLTEVVSSPPRPPSPLSLSPVTKANSPMATKANSASGAKVNTPTAASSATPPMVDSNTTSPAADSRSVTGASAGGTQLSPVSDTLASSSMSKQRAPDALSSSSTNCVGGVFVEGAVHSSLNSPEHHPRDGFPVPPMINLCGSSNAAQLTKYEVVEADVPSSGTDSCEPSPAPSSPLSISCLSDASSSPPLVDEDEVAKASSGEGDTPTSEVPFSQARSSASCGAHSPSPATREEVVESAASIAGHALSAGSAPSTGEPGMASRNSCDKIVKNADEEAPHGSSPVSGCSSSARESPRSNTETLLESDSPCETSSEALGGEAHGISSLCSRGVSPPSSPESVSCLTVDSDSPARRNSADESPRVADDTSTIGGEIGDATTLVAMAEAALDGTLNPPPSQTADVESVSTAPRDTDAIGEEPAAATCSVNAAAKVHAQIQAAAAGEAQPQLHAAAAEAQSQLQVAADSLARRHSFAADSENPSALQIDAGSPPGSLSPVDNVSSSSSVVSPPNARAISSQRSSLSAVSNGVESDGDVERLSHCITDSSSTTVGGVVTDSEASSVAECPTDAAPTTNGVARRLPESTPSAPNVRAMLPPASSNNEKGNVAPHGTFSVSEGVQSASTSSAKADAFDAEDACSNKLIARREIENDSSSLPDQNGAPSADARKEPRAELTPSSTGVAPSDGSGSDSDVSADTAPGCMSDASATLASPPPSPKSRESQSSSRRSSSSPKSPPSPNSRRSSSSKSPHSPNSRRSSSSKSPHSPNSRRSSSKSPDADAEEHRFACESPSCSYTSNRRDHFKRHAFHHLPESEKMKRAPIYMCAQRGGDDCPFKSFRRDKILRHRKRVHDELDVKAEDFENREHLVEGAAGGDSTSASSNDASSSASRSRSASPSRDPDGRSRSASPSCDPDGRSRVVSSDSEGVEDDEVPGLSENTDTSSATLDQPPFAASSRRGKSKKRSHSNSPRRRSVRLRSIRDIKVDPIASEGNVSLVKKESERTPTENASDDGKSRRRSKPAVARKRKRTPSTAGPPSRGSSSRRPSPSSHTDGTDGTSTQSGSTPAGLVKRELSPANTAPAGRAASARSRRSPSASITSSLSCSPRSAAADSDSSWSEDSDTLMGGMRKQGEAPQASPAPASRRERPLVKWGKSLPEPTRAPSLSHPRSARLKPPPRTPDEPHSAPVRGSKRPSAGGRTRGGGSRSSSVSSGRTGGGSAVGKKAPARSRGPQSSAKILPPPSGSPLKPKKGGAHSSPKKSPSRYMSEPARSRKSGRKIKPAWVLRQEGETPLVPGHKERTGHGGGGGGTIAAAATACFDLRSEAEAAASGGCDDAAKSDAPRFRGASVKKEIATKNSESEVAAPVSPPSADPPNAKGDVRAQSTKPKATPVRRPALSSYDDVVVIEEKSAPVVSPKATRHTTRTRRPVQRLNVTFYKTQRVPPHIRGRKSEPRSETETETKSGKSDQVETPPVDQNEAAEREVRRKSAATPSAKQRGRSKSAANASSSPSSSPSASPAAPEHRGRRRKAKSSRRKSATPHTSPSSSPASSLSPAGRKNAKGRGQKRKAPSRSGKRAPVAKRRKVSSDLSISAKGLNPASAETPAPTKKRSRKTKDSAWKPGSNSSAGESESGGESGSECEIENVKSNANVKKGGGGGGRSSKKRRVSGGRKASGSKRGGSRTKAATPARKRAGVPIVKAEPADKKAGAKGKPRKQAAEDGVKRGKARTKLEPKPEASPPAPKYATPFVPEKETDWLISFDLKTEDCEFLLGVAMEEIDVPKKISTRPRGARPTVNADEEAQGGGQKRKRGQTDEKVWRRSYGDGTLVSSVTRRPIDEGKEAKPKVAKKTPVKSEHTAESKSAAEKSGDNSKPLVASPDAVEPPAKKRKLSPPDKTLSSANTESSLASSLTADAPGALSAPSASSTDIVSALLTRTTLISQHLETLEKSSRKLSEEQLSDLSALEKILNEQLVEQSPSVATAPAQASASPNAVVVSSSSSSSSSPSASASDTASSPSSSSANASSSSSSSLCSSQSASSDSITQTTSPPAATQPTSSAEAPPTSSSSTPSSASPSSTFSGDSATAPTSSRPPAMCTPPTIPIPVLPPFSSSVSASASLPDSVMAAIKPPEVGDSKGDGEGTPTATEEASVAATPTSTPVVALGRSFAKVSAANNSNSDSAPVAESDSKPAKAAPPSTTRKRRKRRKRMKFTDQKRRKRARPANDGFSRKTISPELASTPQFRHFTRGIADCVKKHWGKDYMGNCCMFRCQSKFFRYRPGEGTGEYHYDFTGGQIANVLVYLKAPKHSGHTLLDGGKVQLDSKIGRVYIWRSFVGDRLNPCAIHTGAKVEEDDTDKVIMITRLIRRDRCNNEDIAEYRQGGSGSGSATAPMLDAAECDEINVDDLREGTAVGWPAAPNRRLKKATELKCRGSHGQDRDSTAVAVGHAQ